MPGLRVSAAVQHCGAGHEGAEAGRHRERGQCLRHLPAQLPPVRRVRRFQGVCLFPICPPVRHLHVSRAGTKVESCISSATAREEVQHGSFSPGPPPLNEGLASGVPSTPSVCSRRASLNPGKDHAISGLDTTVVPCKQTSAHIMLCSAPRSVAGSGQEQGCRYLPNASSPQ